MPIQTINNGAFEDDPSAESVRDAFGKTNSNFSEAFDLAGARLRAVEFLPTQGATSPRQLTFTVPDGVYAIAVDHLSAPGGSTGGGSLTAGAGLSGSGAGSCGEVVEGGFFTVEPGEVLAVQVGVPGAYGIHEQDATVGSESYIKRVSHVSTPTINPLVTLTLGAGTVGDQTATASAAVFDSGMVGRLVEYGSGIARIKTFTSSTVVTVTVLSAFTITTLKPGWWRITPDEPYINASGVALRCRAGLDGKSGTAALSGTGAPPPGVLFEGGATPAEAAGRSTAGAGAGGASQAGVPARYQPTQDRPNNGGSGGAGGFQPSGSTTASGGGAPGLGDASQLTANFGGVGSGTPLRPGGGGAPGSPAKRIGLPSPYYKAGIQGGSYVVPTVGSSSVDGSAGGGKNGIWPAQAATGACADTYGNEGGPGYVRLLMQASKEAVAELPPVEIIYEGAGRAIPADFTGIHMGFLARGRTATLTGITSGGNTGKIQRVGAGNLLVGDIYQFRFTGTAPAPFDTSTTYYAVGEGASNVFWVRATPTGDPIPATTAGSGGSTTMDDVTPTAEFACGIVRLYDAPEHMWRSIETAPGTYDATNLAWLDDTIAAHVAAGRKIHYTLSQTPTHAIASSTPASDLTLSSASTGNRTVTASASVFVAGDVGRWITVGGARAIILAFTSGTAVDVYVSSAFAGTALASGTWTLGPSGLANNWGNVNGADAPTEAAVRAYIAFLVNRYNIVRHPTEKPIVRIGVWNEPTFSHDDAAEFRGTPENLAMIARAIKLGITDAGTVGETGVVRVLAPEWGAGRNSPHLLDTGSWFARFLMASDGSGGFGRDHIEGVCLHGYDIVGDLSAYPDEPKLLWTVRRLNHDIRRAMRAAGVATWATMPIHNTEWGMTAARVAENYAHTDPAKLLAQSMAEQAGYGWASSILYAWRFVDFGRGIQVNAAMQKFMGDFTRDICGQTVTKVERLQGGAIRFTRVDGPTFTFGA